MSTRSSLFYSFLDSYASLAIIVVSSMVIARLLTPAEIGIFSVTTVLLAFVSTLREIGTGPYLVQERDLTTERIRAVWAVQLGLGLGLACLVLLASHPVSVFYQEPRMRDVMLVMALNYAINPFGALTLAWLTREMRFESLAWMRFLSVLCGALVATWLAWHNCGPISLAFGALANTVVNALVATYFRPKSLPWRPGVRELRRVLAFGSSLTASELVNDLSVSAPELLLGKLQNLTAAGLYSRSTGLVQMYYRLFVDAVSRVCMSWFAMHLRRGESIVGPFLKATAYVTVLGWSFCLAVICLAHPLVRALYGNQWDESVDLARLLSVGTAFSVPAALCHTALLSSGAVASVGRAVVFCALQCVMFVALGASQGLIALGLAMIASAAVSTAIWLQATSRHLILPLRRLLHTLRKSAAVALLAGVGPALALWFYGPYPEHFAMPLVLGGTVGSAGFFVGLMVFKHPLHEEVVAIWSRIKRR